jgi:hypothetical protein
LFSCAYYHLLFLSFHVLLFLCHLILLFSWSLLFSLFSFPRPSALITVTMSYFPSTSFHSCPPRPFLTLLDDWEIGVRFSAEARDLFLFHSV